MKIRFNKTRIFTTCLLLIGLALAAGFLWTSFVPGRPLYEETRTGLGTVLQVKVCCPGERKKDVPELFRKIWQRVEQIEQTMSVFREDSDPARIAGSFRHPVKVHPETYSLLKAGIRWAELTDGAFDFTVGPLVGLWREAGERNVLPAEAQVEATRRMVGYRHVRLHSDGAVEITRPHMKIDLGAIAKGYAVDEIARLLKREGFHDFLIVAGGDIYAAGFNARNRPWLIGVRHPRSADDIVDKIELSDYAVTTSGDYERFYEIQGRRFSHIIDPRTGYPSVAAVSATVLAPSAEEADALSTALCVLGPSRGLRLIDDLGDPYAAMIITNDFGRLEVHQSRRYREIQRRMMR